ncbi:MAG: OsmC family protein [Gammaproteobacteria bacterium]
MNVRIKWLDHMSFVGETSSGHSVVMDGSPEHGGRNLGARPMEMILLGLGGCSSFDIVSILHKSRVDVDDCIIEISAQRADEIPAVFTKIHLHYIVKGAALQDKHVKRAVELTSEKYCSVAKMLEHSVALSYDYEIQDSTNPK